ncbi:MAG: hypothetical protein JW966_03040 [Anaerolineae bacterium]|nr:hypothetical protein [Anaerolineae bacterium]
MHKYTVIDFVVRAASAVRGAGGSRLVTGDIRVSFDKIREHLDFKPAISVEDGVLEVRDAIESGLVGNALADPVTATPSLSCSNARR